MKLKWLDFLIIALTLAGSVAFIRIQSRLSALHIERARIVAAVGEMPIEDPKLVHIKALDTQEPWQWAWRVYLPDNSGGTLGYFVGRGSSGSHGFRTQQQECIARVCLSELSDGQFGLYSRFTGGSSFSSFGSREFCDFLREHRNELKIEQFASQRVEKLKLGDPTVVLFRLSLPDDLAREAQAKFQDYAAKTLIPVVLEVKLDLN